MAIGSEKAEFLTFENLFNIYCFLRIKSQPLLLEEWLSNRFYSINSAISV